MIQVFGASPDALCVVCDQDIVTIRGLWRVTHRIPVERIVAITPYATIIWCSRRGRLRRSRAWFLSSNRYADPSQPERTRLIDWIHLAIRSTARHEKRTLDHLDDAMLADHLRVAQLGQRWTARHRPVHQEDLHSLWTKRVHALEAEIARRTA